ncbi:MAG TPA: hydrogenase maturation protease, partial [Candidatus Methylomirabilis sp.]|nr:hydrogenase maturation protease [Candidatus Methylomirabilis sp.]
LGNILLGDDGLGVHALLKLRDALPDVRVQCLDGGTLGAGLLPYLEHATHVLFLDAIDAPAALRAEGDVLDLPLDVESGDFALRVSPHDLGLLELVRLLRVRVGDRPLTLRLLGARPGSLDVGTELSYAAERALPHLVAHAATMVRAWLREADAGEETTPCASPSPARSSR